MHLTNTGLMLADNRWQTIAGISLETSFKHSAKMGISLKTSFKHDAKISSSLETSFKNDATHHHFA